MHNQLRHARIRDGSQPQRKLIDLINRKHTLLR